MAVYVVTWDLNKEKPNYNQARIAFVSQLDKLDTKKDPGLDSVRFISSSSSATAIRDYLKQKLDDDDRVFVSRLRQGEYQGWLNKDIWPWIRDRV